MRAEFWVPTAFGVLFGMLGIALVVDSWAGDGSEVRKERRRRPRLDRHRGGEALVGFGVLAMAAAFLGRDTWDYSIVAAMVGAAMLLAGGWQNRQFIGETVRNRGALRRRADETGQTASEDRPTVPTPAGSGPAKSAGEPGPRYRIR